MDKNKKGRTKSKLQREAKRICKTPKEEKLQWIEKMMEDLEQESKDN